MNSINQFGDYQDGVKSGQKLLNLFRSINPKFDANCSPAKQSDLDDIYELMWSKGEFGREYPAVKGFLATILRDKEYDGQIATIWGASEFINNQRDYAPVCELDANSGIIQFGSWTGDYSDGDAWCIDMIGDTVVCIPVSSPETRNEALLGAYAVLPDFEYFIAYLRCNAEFKGMIDPLSNAKQVRPKWKFF